MERITEMSPRSLARIAGVLALLEALTAVFGQLRVPSMLVVPGNAAATATNILGQEPLFRLALAAGLLAVAFHVAQTALFYVLFEPVSRTCALFLAFFSLVALALQAVSTLIQLAPLVVLRGGQGLGALSLEQLRAPALRSTFLPRIIGVLMGIAGLGYLAFLWPPFAHYVDPFNLVLAAPGEVSLVLWLLVVGVNVERWKEQASASRPTIG